MKIKKKCVCGKIFITHTYKLKAGRGKFCSKKCHYKNMKRPSGLTYKIVSQNKGWFKKINKIKPDDKGYIRRHVGKNKYKREHRIVMEVFLGRELKKEEVVHHIDGNKINNNIKNLKLMSKKQHDKLHNGKGVKCLKEF